MTTYNLKNYFEQPKGLDTNNKVHLEGTSVYNSNEYTAVEIDAVLSGGASQHYVTIDNAQTITGDKTWNGDSIYNGNTYTPEEVDASLSLYKAYTHTTSFTGPWNTTAPIDCEIIKIGKLVTLRIPSLVYSSNSSAIITMVTAMPVEYRPQQTSNYTLRVVDNAVNVLGYCSIENDGSLDIYSSLINGVFAATNNAGFDEINLSWIVA